MSHYNNETIVANLEAVGANIPANVQFIDAPVNITIKIRKRAAERGVAHDCTRCVIAQEFMSRKQFAVVMAGRLYLWDTKRPGVIMKYIPDTKARNTIRNLDEKDARIWGVELTFKVPSGNTKLGGRSGKAAKSGASGRDYTRAEKEAREAQWRTQRRLVSK